MSRTTKSAPPTSMKGAQGPIVSKMIPPTRAKAVVPNEPKKKATPESVPLICPDIFLMKTTSTDRN